MSDIEQRARDALNSVYGERYCDSERATYYNENDARQTSFVMEAMCREIEAHDATKAELADFKREVSEAVKHCREMWPGNWSYFADALDRFTQPDPLLIAPDDRELFIKLFIDNPDDEDAKFTVRDGRWDNDDRMQEIARYRLTITETKP